MLRGRTRLSRLQRLWLRAYTACTRLSTRASQLRLLYVNRENYWWGQQAQAVCRCRAVIDIALNLQRWSVGGRPTQPEPAGVVTAVTWGWQTEEGWSQSAGTVSC